MEIRQRRPMYGNYHQENPFKMVLILNFINQRCIYIIKSEGKNVAMFKLTLRSQVKTDSRYGTCFFFSDNACITFPSVVSDLLIEPPSFSRVPLVFDVPARSDPAKSIKAIFDFLSIITFSFSSFWVCLNINFEYNY